MALDVGERRIGVAVSDDLMITAQGVEVIDRAGIKKDLIRIGALIRDRQIKTIVLGLPLNMDGSEGPRAQSTHAFIRNCAPLTPLPFIFQDERLSTAAVTRTLIEQDASRAKRAEIVDKMAAAYILQGALDRLTYMARDHA